MRDVANCDMVCDIFLGDNVGYHSKVLIWNGSDPKNIVTIHEYGVFPFVFVICRWCCWIGTYYFLNLNVGWTSGFGGIMGYKQGMKRVGIVESLQQGDNASLWCSQHPASSSTKTSSLDRLVYVFTDHVLGTISQFNTYLFLLPFTQHLMSSGHNQNVGKTKFLHEPFVCWSMCVMFANLNFDIAHSSCIGM